ncbi:MAG: Cys-rich protein [Leptospira bouyouniensis]|uniref:Cys-rich protein n=1 Tax=Leptospira bouyouniensis TaxID=2484911 RepID=A0A7I0HNY7_9LEPT|nr:Cys-rich protein [Leptospira bouyouniensis]TGK47228.1 Cys-rich protein [Leptospira bouyouniensis]TGL03405.1 Cys-rich protein [Leptospira bouyouniensis]TGM80334.1 Cys-rich protein [Leptospira bouyouniensis]
MKQQNKWILVLFLALSFYNCQDIVEQKCQLACEKFVSCTEEELKLTLAPDVKRTGRIQCMDGCTTHNSDILQCFDQEPNSCKGFGQCLVQIGTFE